MAKKRKKGTKIDPKELEKIKQKAKNAKRAQDREDEKRRDKEEAKANIFRPVKKGKVAMKKGNKKKKAGK